MNYLLRWSSRLLLILGLSGMAWIVGVAQSPRPTAPPDTDNVHVRLLVDDLRNPVNLARLPDGTLFIAEEGTGNDDNSAGVSLRQPDGTVGRFISGLPSSRDSGDLSGVALVAVSPNHEMLYVGNFAEGHLWTLPLNDTPLTLPDTPYSPADLGTAFEPFNRVQLTNPFDMTFTAEGEPIVSDASQDGVARQLPDGRTQFFHRFAALKNPTNDELTIAAVPTGIERVEDEFYVTLTGGCPYPAGGGELVAIDSERNQRTVLDNLNMPIDIAQADDGTLWVLEFARFKPDGSCFSGAGYLPNSGRLSRILPDGTLEAVVSDLSFPTSVLPLPDGSLYITQVFEGDVLHVTFGDAPPEPNSTTFQPNQTSAGYTASAYNPIDNVDAALYQVIAERELTARPGEAMREGDTALARLGRDLFFDPVLSGDRNISCATCHHPAFAMADGRVLPIGAGGIGLGPDRDFLTHIMLGDEYSERSRDEISEVANPAIGTFVPRNSPTILNSALLPVQFWDGRVDGYAGEVQTLEDGVNNLRLTDVLTVQALFPVISRDEMAGATFGDEAPAVIRAQLAQRLMNIPAYTDAFERVFGTDSIEPVQVVQALAAFERQLIFTDSDWDSYMNGNPYALTPRQKRGALLFYGELHPDVNCAACHSGDLLTDLQFHNILAPQLGPGKGNGDNGREDWGRANVTFDWRNRFQFRTPSLRNVALTAPYLHSGAYTTLNDVIWHHADMVTAAAGYDPSAHLPPEFYSSVRLFEPASQMASAAPELVDGLPLSERDVEDIVSFLHALTDPDAADLMHLMPESVPGGELDPLPDPATSDISQSPAGRQQMAASLPVDTSAADWQFRNVAQEVGLDFKHGAFQFDLYDDPAAMMGAGLCWLDYNNDGWLDLYLMNSHAENEFEQLAADNALPHNQLYRNDAGQFTPVNAGTQLVMRGNGCLAADFNLDGFTDLYLTADESDVLLQNQGDGTFADVTAAAHLGAPEWTSAAATADINSDGWPDLFVGAYIDLENPIPNPMGAFPQDYFGLPDRLYLSNGLDDSGQVTFREVTRDIGLIREERTLGAVFSDVDNDGDLDLYIANDGQPNRLYENLLDDSPAGFRFVDLTDTASVGDAGSGMGVTSADYDGDGYFDLFVTNWEAELNALYRNQTAENGFINFQYSTYRIGMMGLGRGLTGWGTTWADFDHDTDTDLLIVNGRVPVTNWQTDPEPVHLYGNHLVERGQPHFFEWSERIGLDETGNLLARGSAVADFNNDGHLDVAINSIRGDVVLLEHSGNAGNWLQVQLSRFAPGTVVTVTLPDGRTLVREQQVGSSYLATEDPRLHIGLGDVTQVPEVRVRFPNGEVHVFRDVEAGQILTAGGS